MTTNLIRWAVTTASVYAGLEQKDNNFLYFLTDTNEIYKGDKSFTQSVIMTAEFPSKGALGRIYVNSTTLEGKVWTGTEWKTIINAVSKTLTDEETINTAVTGEAVKSYVTNKFTTELKGKFVEGVSYDKETKSLKVTKDSKEEIVALDGFITDAKYAGETGILTFTVQGGKSIDINLPKEDFVSSGRYDTESHEIILTLTQGGEVKIPAIDLVDIYTVTSTETVELNIEKNNITANIKISSEEGNQIVKKDDGIFVAPGSDKSKMNKVEAEKSGEVLIVKEDGDAKASGIKIGGETLAESPNATTLATEASVSAIKQALENKINTKFDTNKVKTEVSENSTSASDEHVLSEKAVLKKIEEVSEAKLDKSDITTSLNLEKPSNDKVVAESALIEALTWKVVN